MFLKLALLCMAVAEIQSQIGIVKVPENCQYIQCHLILTWNINGSDTDFKLTARAPSTTNTWVAFGFSHDKLMAILI